MLSPSWSEWLKWLMNPAAGRRRRKGRERETSGRGLRRRRLFFPCCERLEDRLAPASGLINLPDVLSGSPGQTDLFVAVHFDNSDGLDQFGVAITYDSTRLSAVSVARGTLASGFDTFNQAITPDSITVSAGNSSGSTPAGAGSLALINFSILAAAPAGQALIDLRPLVSSVSTSAHSPSSGDYTLSPAPADGLDDTDGSITVTQASTSTAIFSSATPSLGQMVTFTATVSAISPGTGTPSGTVTFQEGITTLATPTLDGNAVATFSTNALTLGSHTITAIYGGDTNFVDSSSDPYTQVVAPDRFEPDDSRTGSANIGVGPGVHLNDLGITPGDEDWYRFEVLRPDSIDVGIGFTHGANQELNLEVTDAAGSLLGTGTATVDGSSVALDGLAAGTYFVHVAGISGSSNSYSLTIDPDASSYTRIFYVNDGSTANDVYTLAAGDDANDGLTPGTPMASVQALLAKYSLKPIPTTDPNKPSLALVVIDTGDYGSGIVVITGDDEGTAFAGAPGGSNFSYGGTRFELNDADFNLFYDLGFTGYGGTGIYVHGNGVSPSVNNTFRANSFTGNLDGIRIDGGDSDLIVDNTIAGTGNVGIYLPSGGTATIRGNTISGRNYAVLVSGSPTVGIQNNSLSQSTYGVYLDSGTNTVTGNNIFSNQLGVYARNSGNTIYGNMVHNNVTGIEGYGTFGGSDWSAPNDIYNNTTGIRAYGGNTVQFNRIHGNTVGILANYYGPVSIQHNLIYRNTGQGILVDNVNGVTITNNTIYTPSGDGVRIQNSCINVSLRNNILWVASGGGNSSGGYDLYVTTNSQVGFSSDYNNLYSTGSGKLVWWQKDFVDLFDWQVEADYDDHSIGYTAPNPTLDDPQFVNLADDDYHLTNVVSTSIDAGDPASLFNLEPGTNGGRIDLGAYGDTAEAAQSRNAYVALDYPNYYIDWEAGVGHAILWHTCNVTGNVKLELFQEGAGKVADIGVSPATAGSFGWSPQASGITPDSAKRYRIQISSVDAPMVTDASREPFAVPSSGPDFYINDGSQVNDEYCTAVGSNRNTGKTPGDPKANLLPMLRSYALGPGDRVMIDTGYYVEVRNVVISGQIGVGDDEGATFTGPTDPSRVAQMDRANTNLGSTNIDINGGDYVTLEHLMLVGAQMGLWVHNSSTHFTGTDLTVANNSQDGIRIEADAAATVVDRLTAHDNGNTGIFIATPIAGLRSELGIQQLDRNLRHQQYVRQSHCHRRHRPISGPRQ